MTDSKLEFVVGIGASAGGLNAIIEFFRAVPDVSGMTFCIVQHLSPDFKSLMDEILNKHTNLKISTAQDGEVLKKSHIYLNPMGYNIEISDGKFKYSEKTENRVLNFTIDIFIHSLAHEYKERSVAIILSGTGSDGSRGVTTIKEYGGTVMVQSPESAQFDGMPNSAISKGVAELVGSPTELAQRLLDFKNTKELIGNLYDHKSSKSDIFNKLFEILYKFSGINFKYYKKATLTRRLEKRFIINKIDNLKDYLIILLNNDKEKKILTDDFLINVTAFFRDKDAYYSFKYNALPKLIENHEKNSQIRIWVAGCSTGEEAYSIAITIEEYLRENNLYNDYKIFATDADKQAVEHAQIGRYHINIANDMSKKLLDKYFIKHGDFYQISPKIRDNIIFSRHNLLSDPPFINMDIITCRNLLIYIEAEYQKSILMNFQFAMKFNSILFLGSSESLNSLQDNFSIVDSKWRIYSIRKSAKKLPYNLHFASTTVNKVKYETYPPSKKRVTQENQYAEYLSRIFSPKSIFIDDDYDIKYLNGDLNPYLKFPEGVIEYNLLKIADKSLVSVIQSGLRKVKESISITVIKDIPYKLSELDISITLSFRRYSNSNSNKDLYLITFEENKVDNKDTKIYSFTDFDEFSKQKIDDLEFRLDEKTQQFQKVREELEATNEELQASNEELLASNEELQSTNEELQSVNEELYTVNSELQDKNEELRVVNDEMNNFLNSTKLGILFIDSDMKIKKFNPEVKRLFKFSNHDIGRPLNHFALNIKDENYQILKEQVSDVISSLQESQKEIVFESGNIYIRRITPFITSRNVIDGVVITFIDITKLRETENKVKLGENKLLRLATIVKQSAHSIIYTDLDGNIEYANPAFEQTTDYKLEEIKGKPVNILKSGKHSNQFYKELWSTITSGKIWKGRFINKRKGGFEYLEETTIFPLKNTENEIIGFASIKQDITEQEQVDRKIHMSQNLEYLGVLAGGIAHDFNNLLTSILGGISLLKYEHKDSKNHEHLQILEETESAVNRAQGLSKQLLTFSKGGEPVKKIRNIVDVLKNTTKFILRGSNINLKFSITDDLWRLKFDEGQITQVIQNIIINSKEAMNNVGEIIISVSKFKASKNFIVENNVTANTLDFIKISIKDNGPGISFEDSLKIFNPYFTTKKTGNGLGLATSYSIIKKHHGTIIVNNEIKVGAEFSIYLPKEINIPNNENYAFEIDEIKKKYINVEIPHKTSVLCMDDELIIRETIRRILELFEIKVYLAKNGEEAIELYKQSLEEFTPIDIVVLDLTIVDGMGGVKTMEELLKLEPNIKAIVSSGYSEDIIITNYQEYGFKAVLPKPYTIEQVKEVIFSVLK